MKRFINITIIAIGVTLFSCKPQTNETYYSSGSIKEQVEMKDGKKNGIAKEFYEDGKLKWQGNFINDSLHGESIGYFPNGNKEYEASYRNGVAEGVYRTYYENGQLMLEATFKNGLQEGPYQEYYDNGKLKSKGNHVNGLSHGEIVFYFPNGNIKAKGMEKYNIVEYRKYYSETGQFEKEVRSLFPEDYLKEAALKGAASSRVDTIKLGEVFEKELHLGGPVKDVEVKAYAGEMKENESAPVIIDNYRLIEMESPSTVRYSHKFLAVGRYMWGIKIDVKDKATGQIFTYQYTGSVAVVPEVKFP